MQATLMDPKARPPCVLIQGKKGEQRHKPLSAVQELKILKEHYHKSKKLEYGLKRLGDGARDA